MKILCTNTWGTISATKKRTNLLLLNGTRKTKVEKIHSPT